MIYNIIYNTLQYVFLSLCQVKYQTAYQTLTPPPPPHPWPVLIRNTLIALNYERQF